MIGLGITTQNRRQVALDNIAEWSKLSPGIKIAIVDDHSDRPYPNADFRFNEISGVAKAKNKCLELLENCDHIFLADDDIHPKVENWWLPYITSGQDHLTFTFSSLKSGFFNGNKLLNTENGICEYSNPCGCMMYLTKKCLDTIGGFDTDFGRYGYEHLEYSRRAFNAGLTHAPFIDIENSLDLFYSLDHQQEIRCTFHNTIVKRKLFGVNKQLYADKFNDKHFKPYK